ncbi:MAG: ankyrin repeat domain-containing protein [Myxococcales bacterium]|nr:ankyrin repeat domain-containing protein [Myxococcales bacterium]
MSGWFLVAVAQPSAQAQDLTWQEMAAAAQELLPLTPGEPTWERVPDAHAIDLLQPVSSGRILVGQVQIAEDGRTVPSNLEVWDARTGDLVWSVERPHDGGLAWEVLSHDPLVLAGRSSRAVVLQGLDVATGQSTWSTSTDDATVVRSGESVVIWRRGQLEALSLETGESIWAVPMAVPMAASAADGTIQVQTSEEVISIDAAWGAEDWRHAGSWTARPAADGLGVILHDRRELRWLDAYGQQLWAWTTEHTIARAWGGEGRAVVVLSTTDGDRVVVVSQGAVTGSTPLQGRSASDIVQAGGVVVMTTEDEVLAVSPQDATVAFRTPLPDGFLGWGPTDRPDLAHGQPDMLQARDDQVVVVRERAGIAAFAAAHFEAGQLRWAHLHAEGGADDLSVGGRYRALDQAMSSVTAGVGQSARIARRRAELDAALHRATRGVPDRYYVRPFRRWGARWGVSGVTLVDVQTGTRADVVVAPLFPSVAREGLDMPSVTMDPDLGQLYVASTTANPAMWVRTNLGPSTVPALSVRAFGPTHLGLRVTADGQLSDTSTTLASLNTLIEPSAAADSQDPGIAAPADAPGMDSARCLELGILEATRPELIRRCIDTKVLSLDASEDGRVPILLAAERNHLDTVRLLLDAGADPNKAETHDRRTALERSTDPDVIALLIGEGARTRSEKEQQAGVKRLLKLAGIRKPNAAFCFHHISRGRTDVLDACLATKKGLAVLRHIDPEQGSVLHIAAEKGRVTHVRRLLDSGANPNLLDKSGITPLDRIDAMAKEGPLLLSHEKAMRLLELAGGA